jgi:tryptophanyl-tRNA synthetase
MENQNLSANRQKRIFSGIQPTGNLHIGNYLGAIKNWLELQDQYQCVFCIVDYHALTVRQNPKIFQKKILEIAKIYLAAGINPEKSIIFVQSNVSQHTELAWILNTLTKIPELNRMTQFKEKSERFEKNVNVGLFDYPVLMAADILLYQTDIVPVGEDQTQHIELTKILAKRFNKIYGNVFKIPEGLIKKEGARIMSLDNPIKKMSKTSPNPTNYLALTDSPEIIRKKIKTAVTDSGKEIKLDLQKPAVSNLLMIYHLLSQQPIQEIEKKYKNKGYAEFKNDLAEIIVEFLEPFQQKFQELEKNEDYVKKVLSEGAEKAQIIAEETMKKVRKKIGLIN